MVISIDSKNILLSEGWYEGMTVREVFEELLDSNDMDEVGEEMDMLFAVFFDLTRNQRLTNEKALDIISLVFKIATGQE